MTLYQSIAGKYFINSLQAAVGMRALMRGRVLGPIANELSTFYLCEIFPSEDDKIAITTETVLPVEQLVGVYFYETRPMLDAAWADALRVAKAQLDAVKKERMKTIAQIQQRFVRALQAEGITVIDASKVRQAAAETAVLVRADDESDD